MPRILLIDDDQTVLDLEAHILSNEGHEVIMINQARSALDLLELYDVDLIIVDVQMPHFDGFQFVSTLKNNPDRRNIAIAFCTSHHDKDHVDRAAKLGADFYLVKPIVREKFVEKIAAFFEKHPTKQRPRIEFQMENLTEVKILQTVRLVFISDLGVEILINQEMTEGQSVELPSSIFHGVFSDNPVFKVLSVTPHLGDWKKVFLMLLDRDVKTVKKLRRLIQSRKTR